MAVIDTSMDMPSSCHFCNKQNCKYNNTFWGDMTTSYRDSRHKDCPLKSIDGLSQEIEQFPFTYGFASDIDRVINKYCDKENKDVNR